MIIGIDFDNTLVSYSRVFLALARRQGLLPPDFQGEKEALRDAIRLLPDGESHWMSLQASAYGPEIVGAEPAEGALEFLARAERNGVRVVIVSHKTAFAAAAPKGANLRDAARGWLDAQGLLSGSAIARDDVYFEGTFREKIDRIRMLGCTHFIDDLEEVLLDPALPPALKRYWYAAGLKRPPVGPYPPYRSWSDITTAIFPR